MRRHLLCDVDNVNNELGFERGEGDVRAVIVVGGYRISGDPVWRKSDVTVSTHEREPERLLKVLEFSKVSSTED